MATQRLAIPTDESGFKVELAYLERWRPGQEEKTPLSFLARKSSPETDEEMADAYQRNLPLYRRDFGELLGDRAFELVLSPPSRRSDLDPYRNEVVSRGIARTDLSHHFSRSEPRSSRRNSFDQLIDALSFDGDPSLARARSLLIVDDYFVTGRTAAALLSILRSHGFPADGEVTVACPLWVDRTG